MELERPPDIVCIQDPPLELAFKPIPRYDRYYTVQGGRKLHMEDCPGYKPHKGKNDPKTDKDTTTGAENADAGPKLEGVAFLVHDSLPYWHVRDAMGDNKGLASKLYVEGVNHWLVYYNAYNREKKLNIDLFFEGLETGDECINVIMMDSNLHHADVMDELMDPNERTSASASLLHQLLGDNEMVCLNKSGVATWTRGEETLPGTQRSAIDLVCVDGAYQSEAVYKLHEGVKGFTSDHRISSLSIPIELERRSKLRYNWSSLKREVLYKNMEEQLRAHFGSFDQKLRLTNLCMTLKRLDELVGILSERQSVDVEKSWTSGPRRPPKQNGVQSSSKESDPLEERDSLKERDPSKERDLSKEDGPLKENELSEEPQPGTGTALSERPRPIDLTSPVITFDSGEVGLDGTTPGDLHRVVKSARDRVAPKVTREMPSLKVAGQSELVIDEEGKKEAFLNSKLKNGWSVKYKKEIGCPCGVEKPIRDPGRKQFEIELRISEIELEQLLVDLPARKSLGPCGIANELLKICAPLIAPFLAQIFNKLLEFGHHPRIFKQGYLLAILKPNKNPNDPASYRPLAILSNIGKILERIVCLRMKEIVLREHLLPNVQFGMPGKSTTLAVEYIVNSVHKAWQDGQLISLFSLDLSGAYDKVNPKKLLEELARRGMPDSIIEFIWSFLSDRCVDIILPGQDSSESAGDKYWLYTGVPQGSPLSPLLFLLHAAVLITKVQQNVNNLHEILAFVDDTYITITGTDRQAICKKFEKIHEILIHGPGDDYQFEFAPQKYNILHFTKPTRGQKVPADHTAPNLKEFKDLDVKDLCPESLRVLGVKLDRCLTFENHVQDLWNKIRRDLAIFRRCSGALWGCSLECNREFWRTTIYARLSYAAPAWFIYSPNRKLKYGLHKRLIEKLRSIQMDCWLTLSASRRATKFESILAEVHIPHIIDKLYIQDMTHRCKHLATLEYKDMFVIRSRRFRSRKQETHERILSQHPYQELDREAELLLNEFYDQEGWDKLNRIRFLNKGRWVKMLKSFLDQKLQELSQARWHKIIATRVAENKYLPLTYRSLWGNHTLKLYARLDRAQSTMAMYIRSGNIPLNINPVWRNQKGIMTKRCPGCNVHDHTAEHLFFHFKALARPRYYLMAEINYHHDFERLMTINIEVATSWAIQYFAIEMFDSARKKGKYNFPRKKERD